MLLLLPLPSTSLGEEDSPRLIERYLPTQEIGTEAQREKSLRSGGHICSMHKWWARKPLVACRAAVYGTLVSAETKRQDAEFLEKLCKYPASPQILSEAQRHILEDHAERLSRKEGRPVTVEDVVEGRAPRPKVLDIFTGGGAIPLEAACLGCEAYAIDLNPVAHLIELCTLVYPQKYGKPDSTVRGMTGQGATWGGLANEVRHWGKRVLEKVEKETQDLYPPIPGPDGDLIPVSYRWTHTVRCKNPACGATVPLAWQTWLFRKKGRYVALRMDTPKHSKKVRFEVVESSTEEGLGFDPRTSSKGGNAPCPFCGTMADSAYVKAEGCAKRMGRQMMAIICSQPGRQEKVYLSADDYPQFYPDDEAIRQRIEELCRRTGLTVPREPIIRDSKSGCRVQLYGMTTFGDLFTPRQMLYLLTFASAVREIQKEIERSTEPERAKAIGTYLAFFLDRAADYNSVLCRADGGSGKVHHTFSLHALPMVWDFVENTPEGLRHGFDFILDAIESVSTVEFPATVVRGSATNLPWPEASFDAVITDPPYYDNVPYSNISDFFYTWLKRTVGHLYPEHFSEEGTPKEEEAVADATRHGGSSKEARVAFERMMAQAFSEAKRVLKPDGLMVVIYASKSIAGWATVIDALRRAGFLITEAWSINTEMRGRLRALIDSSAVLDSSIFLVARKREGEETGSYEKEVLPELSEIVCARIDSLWKMKVAGADLVISAVGAGLRAYTRFSRVVDASGEEVATDKFLAEIEGLIIKTFLRKVTDPSYGIDEPSRSYVVGHFYRQSGKRFKDFTERGWDERLGLPNGSPQTPVIDVLHRTLWLFENQPQRLGQFLSEASPDFDKLCLVAQTLAGSALSDRIEGPWNVTTSLPERSALRKLLARRRALERMV